MALPRIVSLFSGPGGLDLGFVRAGYQVVLAVDISEAATRTHVRNFPGSKAVTADIVEIGAPGILALLKAVLPFGDSIAVVGGPPCQGFSRANVSASPNDPRNRLPILYLETVELLQRHYDVQFVLFENVLGIRDSKHEQTFEGILNKFDELGLAPTVQTYCAADYGVPQVRNRVIISAFKNPAIGAQFELTPEDKPRATVRQTIGSLPEPAYFDRSLRPEDIPHHANHWTMRPRSKRFSQPSTNRGRSFRTVAWDLPSPTVAYGHREIHVHPDGHRRLSIFEAMLLQGFPASFVLEGNFSAQVEQVSNAVPPPLATHLAIAAARAIAAV